MCRSKATPETYDPIARVLAMLEQSKNKDGTQRYMEQLNKVVTDGRANLSAYAETSKSEANIKKRILNFIRGAPKYSGNPEKLFK